MPKELYQNNSEMKADDVVQKAVNTAATLRMEAEVTALELVNHTKEIAAKAETLITLAEDKAKSLIERAAKEATDLIGVAHHDAIKLYDEPKGPTPNISVMANDVGYIKKSVEKIEAKLEKDYLTRAEFDAKFGPIQKGVYAVVGFVLISVLGVLGTVMVFVLSTPK